ncbi:Hypothetical protein RADP37_05300 [Roseomonas mucosa]|uniref:Uncharacterized protein n=1 Tax=Roseomonas mucosa TaxID=207340 RepID=A0A4Y1MW47_9PROT|nr:DUF6441 family protein [Roseomonas mucosa]AWV21714.1 Hypothetical protein RADP37_05300 [Roseomonas mucosa]MDT8276702.1 DUF6441 family protein [Roseomonas mucosa]MDT8355250.1 DUF6441 family protein [Roseomonas mucosa]
MKVTARISGSLRETIQEQTILAAGAIRRGVEEAGQEIQAELREQVAKAGFRGGGRRVANAWRLRVYPRQAKATLHPAALIYTQAPDIIDAFETGNLIAVKKAKYLCWPTGFNATSGRRNAGSRGGLRVTPQEMIEARDAVVLPVKDNPAVKLWCLRVRQASSIGGRSGRGRGRIRLYVGRRNVEVNTGRGKASDKALRTERILKYQLVPMFFLARQVDPRKRFDVAGVAKRADAVLERRLLGRLNRA